MVTEAVLDTSYLLAWHRENDRLHEKASRIQAALTQAGSIPYVLDCVYSELIAVLARTRVDDEGRFSEFLREEIRLRDTYWSSLVWMSYIGGRDLLETAISVCREAAENFGVGISPHDSMLLIFCRDHHIPFLVSFDRDLGRVEMIDGNKLDVLVIDDSNVEELLTYRCDLQM